MKKLNEKQQQLLEKLYELLEYGYTGEYEGEFFIVVDSWDEKNTIEEGLEMSLEKLLTELGYDWTNWGFADEFSRCDSCNKIIRTSPDGYNWIADYCLINGNIYCSECIKLYYIEEYIDTIKNNHKRANTILTDEELIELGFKSLEGEYEFTLHFDGNNSSPEEQLKELEKHYDEVVFSVIRAEQFGVEWTIWVRNEDE